MKANHCFNVVLKNMSMWQLQDSHQSLPSLLCNASMKPKIMTDEEEAVPPIPKLGVAHCALSGYVGCRCCGACCLALLCLLQLQVSPSSTPSGSLSVAGLGTFPELCATL